MRDIGYISTGLSSASTENLVPNSISAPPIIMEWNEILNSNLHHKITVQHIFPNFVPICPISANLHKQMTNERNLYILFIQKKTCAVDSSTERKKKHVQTCPNGEQLSGVAVVFWMRASIYLREIRKKERWVTFANMLAPVAANTVC